MTARPLIWSAILLAHALVGCGTEGSDGPPDVTLGETTIVVIVNPQT
jgi:hypothetical protein